METLIISVIFSIMVFGIYLLKKQSDKTRQQMIDEMEEIENLHSYENYFPDWEDKEADVHPEK
jgi:hypothetical protein